MKKLILSVLLLFAVSAVMPALAQTKEKKEIKTTASKFEKTRGTDENIKTAKPTDDQKVAKKDKSRGALCYLTVDNFTFYTIDIYIDGDWYGTIGAYGSGNINIYTSGETKLYAKSIGGTCYWGPQLVSCYEGAYTWKLCEEQGCDDY